MHTAGIISCVVSLVERYGLDVVCHRRRSNSYHICCIAGSRRLNVNVMVTSIQQHARNLCGTQVNVLPTDVMT